MPTWKEVNAALQSWFSDEPPAPTPKPEVKIIVVIMDYFKGGK